WSGGTMKQSPWPQQNSPLPLRNRPREIQLSWASAIEPKDNDAANNTKRARMGLRIHKVPSCPHAQRQRYRRKKVRRSMLGRRLQYDAGSECLVLGIRGTRLSETSVAAG